jgi:hypothetical protein
MLAALSDLDLLYYADDSVSNNKGKRVEFGEITMKELPHKAPADSYKMGPSTMESQKFRIKRFDEFN